MSAAQKRHALRYRVAVALDGTRHLVCQQCGQAIVGARTDFTGRWMNGVHVSDFEAGDWTLAPDGGYELQEPGLPI